MPNTGCEILAVNYLPEKRMKVVTRQGSFVLQAFGTSEIMVKDFADILQKRLADPKGKPDVYETGVRIGMKPCP